ncbi:MAG TPA: helix-turn-helix transcriptional regulator [Solirubrobacteraceae bacterium]|nr:helix-turn-helix transcriptional regulator [Solirubrobacteraceae bacterium]
MKPEVLKGHLDSILLAALEPQPLHGYAIMEKLRARSRASIDLPTGTVYPALHRLERAGLIESDWSTVSGRRRRTYRLTTAGRRKLREDRASWRQFSKTVSMLLDTAPAKATP